MAKQVKLRKKEKIFAKTYKLNGFRKAMSVWQCPFFCVKVAVYCLVEIKA